MRRAEVCRRGVCAAWCVVWALVLGAVACAPSGAPASEQARAEVVVFAASSLAEAFQALEREFERAHPETDVRLVLAGSQVLRMQIEQGATADVFASANAGHMGALAEAGLVSERRPLADNALVVIVPDDNPAKIERFEQLDRAERLVVGADGVPVGDYTRDALGRARDVLGASFARRVEGRIVSREGNARLVRVKVELGEADAAIVYRTDAVASSRVRAVPIPDAINARARYWIGGVRGPRGVRDGARRFLDYAASPGARATLARHGFDVRALDEGGE